MKGRFCSCIRGCNQLLWLPPCTLVAQIDNIEDNDASREMKGMLIENVQEAIGDLVDLIKTFRSKNKITQVVVSTMFKTRMDETQAVINQTFSELMVSSAALSTSIFNPCRWTSSVLSDYVIMRGTTCASWF